MLKGQLKKLQAQHNSPVNYALPLGEELIPLNPFLGQSISLKFLEKLYCIHCNKPITKSFNQGYCYPCFQKLAACDLCIMRPELCHYAKGTCREPQWAEQHCMQPHVVYLANTSSLKVGISRQSQIPTRWLDQGAEQALIIFIIQNRYQSGIIEHNLKEWIADRTNWRLMLQAKAPVRDLVAERDQLLTQANSKLIEALKIFNPTDIQRAEAEVQTITYPVLEYPKKIVSHDLEKKPKLEGTLLGIKGQYLIMDTAVINIRKYTGYVIEFAGT